MQKFKDVALAVIPITLIVILLNFTIAPIGNDLMWKFLIGAIFIILGLSIFLFGVDLGIQPIGSLMGSTLAKKKNIGMIVIFGVILGFLINVAEPDLLILARQINDVTSGVMSQLSIVLVVSVGVGILVAVGLIRIVFKIPLNTLLTILYGIIFVLAIIASDSVLGIAFDSGGATTGSMTVPFILALGMGVSSVQGGKESEEDSFGLVGVASAGPMIAVLTMTILSKVTSLSGDLPMAEASTMGIFATFFSKIPHMIYEVALAMLPLIGIFLVFQFLFFKLNKRQLSKIFKGLIYTFIGFILFLTGVNAGFMEAGNAIGFVVASLDSGWIVILIGFVLGFTVIFAEPAVYVLNEQIETVTSGHIKKKVILYTLSIGVATAVALSMIRILVPGLKLWHFLLPGYLIAIILSYFAPKLFVGIAFDSGGVASGPMTATFILSFTQGVAQATEGANVLLDGFGVIAMVALTPLIAIQILGLLYERKARKRSC